MGEAYGAAGAQSQNKGQTQRRARKGFLKVWTSEVKSGGY